MVVKDLKRNEEGKKRERCLWMQIAAEVARNCKTNQLVLDRINNRTLQTETFILRACVVSGWWIREKTTVLERLREVDEKTMDEAKSERSPKSLWRDTDFYQAFAHKHHKNLAQHNCTWLMSERPRWLTWKIDVIQYLLGADPILLRSSHQDMKAIVFFCCCSSATNIDRHTMTYIEQQFTDKISS